VIPHVKAYLGKWVMAQSGVEAHKSEDFVFTHGDFNSSNILIIPETSPPNEDTRWKLSGILDWEWAGSYPAEYEVKYGLGWLRTSPELMSDLVQHILPQGLNSDRDDIYEVEKCVARLDNYRDFYKDETKASVVRKFTLDKLAKLLLKCDIVLPGTLK